MNRFYRVAVEKLPIGTAVQHREPPLEGEVVVKVTDAATRGDYRLVVVDADDAQHEGNIALPGVEALEEEGAVKLAARYQPGGARERPDPRTGEMQTIQVPAVDLAAILAQRP